MGGGRFGVRRTPLEGSTILCPVGPASPRAGPPQTKAASARGDTRPTKLSPFRNILRQPLAVGRSRPLFPQLLSPSFHLLIPDSRPQGRSCLLLPGHRFSLSWGRFGSKLEAWHPPVWARVWARCWQSLPSNRSVRCLSPSVSRITGRLLTRNHRSNPLPFRLFQPKLLSTNPLSAEAYCWGRTFCSWPLALG